MCHLSIQPVYVVTQESTLRNTNKHGLSRNIPAAVKREVRQRCGFGCVVCGLAIIQYEHVDPEYADAKEHDPNKITALCGACHDKVTRRVWSKEKVIRHNEKPKCVVDGYASDFFDIGQNVPKVVFGGTEWIETPVIIEALGETILGLARNDDSGMVEMSGVFHNDDDQEIFRIENNEWKGSADNFDIDVVGNVLTVRKEKRKIALKIRVEPPNAFIVEEIDMLFRGARISGVRGQGFKAVAPDGSTIVVAGLKAENCAAGVIIGETSVSLGQRCKKLRL